MSRYVWDLVLSNLDSPRCPGCPGPGICHPVPSDHPSELSLKGIPHCKYVFIGEAPGENEDQFDRPFIGRAGKEFNQSLLPLAGLGRNMIYLTNTRKCRPPNNRKPSDYAVESCGGHFLPVELAITDPRVVVLMGGTACSLIETDSPDDEIDLEVHHGRARRAKLFGTEYWVFPTYHPALGLHDPSKIRFLRQDFIDLRRFLDDGFLGAQDAYAGRENYYLLGSDHGATDYCGYILECIRWKKVGTLATDTESVDGKFWSWQVSIEPGKSIMGMADDIDSVKLYMQMLDGIDHVVMHNADHDRPELLREGIVVPWFKVIDTMQIAARLGESQGLKPLAGRHCGMKMRSYMEVVKPHSKPYVIEWLGKVSDALPDTEEIERYVTPKKQEHKTRVVVTKNPLRNKINQLTRNIEKNPKFDPWKSWTKFLNDTATEAGGEKVKGKKTFDQDRGYLLQEWANFVCDEFGGMPTVGLDKVPIAEAKWYACRDSDANIRVFNVLDKMEREFGKQVSVMDHDCNF